MATISAEGFEAENPWEEWTHSGDGPTASFSSTPTGQPACRTMPDVRIAGLAAGRQLRRGIVMSYRNEAELAAERKRPGVA